VARWSNLSAAAAETILRKLESRSRTLGLVFRPGRAEEKLLDIVSLATALAMDYAYTGRLTGCLKPFSLLRKTRTAAPSRRLRPRRRSA